MTTFKNANNFAAQLVNTYAKLDRVAGQYDLTMSDIPAFDLHKLSSLILLDDPMRASEATGPDNDHYENYMLPALTLHLSDITNLDKRQDFLTAWADGVLAYNYRAIESMLEDHLTDFNDEHGVTSHGNIYPANAGSDRTWIYAG